ncbi:MAG: nicotinate-nucleotide adenylyltransferase [Pseudomonadota bacterium]|nr:nicotinate-nucleotide adenylyltransferase [Pseudomonadota bacterium]
MPALHVLYGGTFDPIHAGHLAIARAARDLLGVPVHLMPAADPPHRPPPGASAVQRVDMLELALQGEPGLQLDLRELRRSGRSWSVDTLRELRAGIGDVAPVALLVGADSFAGLPSWKSWRELFDLTHFVVASREVGPGQDQQAGESLPAELATSIDRRVADGPRDLEQAPAGRVLWLRQPLHPHSATEIRARIASGQPWRHLVPAAVADYIEAHGLYRGRTVTGP